MTRIRRAIMSCYDKTGAADLARTLREFDIQIVSTTGTLETLREAGVEATSLADFTGTREMLGGRVKSLHPKVHAGLLSIRDNKLHNEEMQAYQYEWIDMVVVNLHPVQSLFTQAGIALDEAIDQIDIGGTAMIRSAAKNFRYVTVVVNPRRYSTVEHEMRAHDGAVSFPTRYKLAQEAFACTAEYDRLLAEFLRSHEPAD